MMRYLLSKVLNCARKLILCITTLTHECIWVQQKRKLIFVACFWCLIIIIIIIVCSIKSEGFSNEITLHSLMYDFLSRHVLEFNLSTLLHGKLLRLLTSKHFSKKGSKTSFESPLHVIILICLLWFCLWHAKYVCKYARLALLDDVK